MKTKDFTIKDASGKEIGISIKTPSYEDFEEADKVYGAKIASMIRENKGKNKLLMRKELDEFLRDQNIWTEADEKKVGKLQEDVDGLLAKMRKGGIKQKEGRTLAIQVRDKRMEIVRIMSKRQTFDDATIESFADAEKNDYLVYACTVYTEDGKNYWLSFEDMKNDKISEVYQKAVGFAYEIVYNISPEFEKNLPENKWLKRHGFVDDELNFIDNKTKEFVDRDGNPVKQLEEMAIRRLENLQGDIVEAAPYLDEEGNPVVTESKTEPVETEKSEEKKESTAEVKT